MPKGSWTCPPKFCPKYNQSVPFEDRIDTILGYFDLDPDEIPAFTALYFSDPDSQGHVFGPDHAEITKAVARLDAIVGRLIDGLEKRGIFEQVTLILVGDHGMVGTCRDKYLYLEDLRSWIEIPGRWVQSQGQLLAIRPPDLVPAAEVVEKMNAGLSSGNIENGNRMSVYLKEDLPERLHYSDSNRICPIIGLVEEGYTVEVSRSQGSECGGAHGYDNDFFSMRSIFIGHGPRFEKGRRIPSFENVEIYNLMASILGVKGAPNNGSDSFVNSVLLPST